VRRVQSGPLVTCATTVALVSTLVVAVPLPRPALIAGLAAGVLGAVALELAIRWYAAERLGPADRVTLARAVLGSGVLVLAVGDGPALLLGAILLAALVLDGVDGLVARRTGTTSALGARLDMEVDALLILVLSWHVATAVGWWVLCLGLARYLFAVLVWLTPGLQHDPPPRPWCKTVAVLVAAALAAAAVGLLPGEAEALFLLAAAALLAESFAHEAVDRWRVGVRARGGALVLGGSRG
jgi:phosphatidylglycerophosphate synthase